MAKGFKFNPGFQSDDEAVANFVVRSAEFSEILNRLGNALSAAAPTLRLLVVAPRGAGKTTLCRRVVAEVRRSTTLRRWEPIFLGEESYGVTTSGEFFLECLAQLLDQTRDPAVARAHEKALGSKSEGELLASSKSGLHAYAHARNKKLLLIVENFHMIIRDQLGRGADDLLNALDDPEHFGVLATSVVQAVTNGEDLAPRDFNTIPLRPLTLPECRTLWSSLTGKDVSLERIRPLQILTGGSPRLMHILSEFMKTPSLRDLMGELNFLIDSNTEYFKSQLDALPTIERKVFAALLDIWDPTTAKQIAETARVTTNVASSMLARLADRGAVTKEQGEGRAALYYAAERLFNIYYLMRRRSSPSSRVKALVSFMTGYYDKDELISTTAQIVREACNLSPDRRAEYHSTYDAILSKSPEAVRDQIIKQTPSDFMNSLLAERGQLTDSVEVEPNSKYGGEKLSADAIQLLERARAAEADEEWDEASRLTSEALVSHPASAFILTKQTLINLRLGRADAAISSAKAVAKSKPDSAISQMLLGLAYVHAERFEDADGALRKAFIIDPKNETARSLLARVKEAIGRPSEAIKLYKKDEHLSDRSRVEYARLLQDQGKTDLAEAALRKNLDAGPDHLLSRRALVDLLQDQGRQAEGVALLREDAETSKHWKSWADLGTYLLMRTDDAPGARDALKIAIDAGADSPRLYELLARALKLTAANSSEIAVLAESVEKRFGENPVGLISAGNIYRDLKMSEPAEAAYRSAAEIEEGTEGLSSLASLLATLPARRDEAATLFQSLLENDKEACSTARDYAQLLVRRGADSEARKVLKSAISRNADCHCCLVLEAEVLTREGNFKKAKSTYEKALKIYPNGVPALTGLSRLLDHSGAKKLIDQAVEVSPMDPRPLLERARRGPELSHDPSGDARAALLLDPSLLEAHLFLAEYEARAEKMDAAVSHLAVALDALPERRDLTSAFVRSCMMVASDGDVEAVKHLLSTHENGVLVEPLVVAVRMLSGEHPIVAKVVEEVARDILKIPEEIAIKRFVVE